MSVSNYTVLIGINGALMMGPAGTSASTELKNVRGVELKLSWSTEEVTTRGSGDTEEFVKTLKKIEVTFKMLNIVENADVATVRAAFISPLSVAIKCLDQSNGWGVDGDFIITECNLAQGLKDVQELSVTAIPGHGIRKLMIGASGSGE